MNYINYTIKGLVLVNTSNAKDEYLITSIDAKTVKVISVIYSDKIRIPLNRIEGFDVNKLKENYPEIFI